MFDDIAADGDGAPSAEDLASFPLNDIGNAKRLMLLAGCRIDRVTGRVDHSQSRLLFRYGHGWIAYNGRFWDLDLGNELALELAHAVADKLRGLHALLVETHHATGKVITDFIDGAGNAGKSSSMLRQAQAYLTVKIEVFDRDPLAINCANGTLRLSYAGGKFEARLHDHNPADRITKISPVAYDPEAEAPTFDLVLRSSLRDVEDQKYFARLLGYASTGLIKEQAFMLLQGKGRDGKSTLIDACREALGTYAETGNIEVFLESPNKGGTGPQPELVKLAGDVRLVGLSEPKRGAAWNEGLLKAWTGGEPLSVRDLNRGNFNFRPVGKLIIQCNPLPKARADDEGMWRRMMPLLFKHQVPKDQVDRDIPDRIRQGELPGVLNWLVKGVEAYLRAGGLKPPETALSFLAGYRKVSSPFGDWLDECCVYGDDAPGERTNSKVLYDSYKEWAAGEGHDKPMSARAFGDALNDRQILLAGKDRSGNKRRGPIRLKTDQERHEDAEAEALHMDAMGQRQGAEIIEIEDDESPFDAS